LRPAILLPKENLQPINFVKAQRTADNMGFIASIMFPCGNIVAHEQRWQPIQMKTKIEITGCFPVLNSLNEQQFINAIEPRFIDIRNPVTGLQIDLFGKVSALTIAREQGIVVAEIEIPDDFLARHNLQKEQLEQVLVARVSKLRHPATGAMAPVEARLAAK
jgi:hypothetical protein